MSRFCSILIIGILFSIPVLLVILIIRAIKKKPIKKISIGLVMCVVSILPLTILGALTDPATLCKHERELISETRSTCTVKGKVVEYCDICDVDVTTYKDKLPHDYQLVETVEATCKQKGKLIHRCSQCNDEDIERTPKVAHDYQVSETKEATCTEPGYIVKKCAMCSSTQKTNIEAIGHTFVDVSRTDPTCTERGKTIQKCTLCATEDIEYTDKIAHSWVADKAVGATCTSGGYEVERCEVCSTTQKIEVGKALGHDMKESSRIEPTRETEGKIVYCCERCDHEETKTIDKLPPLTYIEGVEFEEIYKAYKANELRADETYKNNRYRITAEINGIETGGLFNITGGATLTMVVKVGNTYVYFYAEFEKEQEEALKTVNVGDTITFEGECLSAGSWVECEIITKH